MSLNSPEISRNEFPLNFPEVPLKFPLIFLKLKSDFTRNFLGTKGSGAFDMKLVDLFLTILAEIITIARKQARQFVL